VSTLKTTGVPELVYTVVEGTVMKANEPLVPLLHMTVGKIVDVA
jgi:hypothetical protein